MFSMPVNGGVTSVLQRRFGMGMVGKVNCGANFSTLSMPNRQSAPSSIDARSFVSRHIGPGPSDVQAMLDAIGVASLDALIDATVPESIRLRRPLALPDGLSENDALK